MRIIHTADWHLGRTLEGRSRLPEQADFIDELVEMVEEERIDLILMAGDLFDTYNPPAEAEELFYESLARLTDLGRRKMICIAGNHDHPDRVAAATPLAENQGIYLLGLPAAEVIQIRFPNCEEEVRIYALPYPSESRLRKVLSEEIAEEAIRLAYDQRIAQMFADKRCFFSPHTVNLAMSHLFVQGGIESDSEREIQVGGAYTVSPASLPDYVQYVALGHLHRPQNVKGSPAPARYSGSPIAYSFSEAGQAKSVTLLEVKPNQPPKIEELYIRSGRPLVTWEAKEGIEQLMAWLEEGRDRNAWINVEVHVNEALPADLTHKIRKAHAGILHVRPVYPELAKEREQIRISQYSIEELFTRFFKRQTNGAEPDPETVQLFLQLIEEEEEDRCAP